MSIVITLLIVIPSALTALYLSTRPKPLEALASKRKRKVLATIPTVERIIISDSVTDYMKFSIDVIGRKAEKDRLWQQGTFLITKTYIALYNIAEDTPLLHVPLDSLRGYFYIDRDNKPYQLWVHIEAHQLWYLLKFQFDHVQTSGGFRELRRVFDSLAHQDIKIGYQLDAPYSHLGSAPAYEVNADDETWLIDYAIQIFLTPLFLLVMDNTGVVLYKIPLNTMTEVELLHTIDEHGIIQITANGAYHAFAMKDYNRWQKLISLAIKKLQ